MPGLSCTILVSCDAQVQHLNSLYSLIQLHLFYNQHLQNWQRMQLLLIPSLQTFNCELSKAISLFSLQFLQGRLPGDLMVKRKLFPCSGSAALRQVNPTIKRNHNFKGFLSDHHFCPINLHPYPFWF